jgi:hypothetical protein
MAYESYQSITIAGTNTFSFLKVTLSLSLLDFIHFYSHNFWFVIVVYGDDIVVEGKAHG